MEKKKIKRKRWIGMGRCYRPKQVWQFWKLSWKEKKKKDSFGLVVMLNWAWPTDWAQSLRSGFRAKLHRKKKNTLHFLECAEQRTEDDKHFLSTLYFRQVKGRYSSSDHILGTRITFFCFFVLLKGLLQNICMIGLKGTVFITEMLAW